MCTLPSTTVKTALDKAIVQLVAEPNPFTAYHVTQRARQNRCYESFTHYDVREYIHDTLASYVTDGALTRAQHGVYSAIEYTPVSQAILTVAQPVAPVGLGAVPVGLGGFAPVRPAPNVWGTKLPRDNRGRVCLKKADVIILGAKPGDIVHAAADPVQNKVYIGFSSNLPFQPFASYKVDADNNVRISPKVLHRAKVTSQAVYCENNGSFISVE